jgi:hypothetical protein
MSPLLFLQAISKIRGILKATDFWGGFKQTELLINPPRSAIAATRRRATPFRAVSFVARVKKFYLVNKGIPSAGVCLLFSIA